MKRDYQFEVQGLADSSNILNIQAHNIYKHDANYINKFPYRINRSIKILSENLSTNAIRTFKINSYYDVPNDKGEIIALRGMARHLYIQTRFTLYLATIKDVLRT